MFSYGADEILKEEEYYVTFTQNDEKIIKTNFNFFYYYVLTKRVSNTLSNIHFPDYPATNCICLYKLIEIDSSYQFEFTLPATCVCN